MANHGAGMQGIAVLGCLPAGIGAIFNGYVEAGLCVVALSGGLFFIGRYVDRLEHPSHVAPPLPPLPAPDPAPVPSTKASRNWSYTAGNLVFGGLIIGVLAWGFTIHQRAGNPRERSQALAQPTGIEPPPLAEPNPFDQFVPTAASSVPGTPLAPAPNDPAESWNAAIAAWRAGNANFLADSTRYRLMDAALAEVDAASPGLPDVELIARAQKLAFRRANWNPTQDHARRKREIIEVLERNEQNGTTLF